MSTLKSISEIVDEGHVHVCVQRIQAAVGDDPRERGVEILVGFLEQTLRDQLKGIIEMVEGMKLQTPTNDLRDVTMALRDPKTLTEQDLRVQQSRDERLRNKFVIVGATNETITNIQSKLTTLLEE